MTTTPVGSPKSRLDSCNCYVKTLDAETRMTLRWGAHEWTCPTYRPSRDPVDAMNDGMARAAFKEAHAPIGWGALYCARCHEPTAYVHEAFLTDPDAPDPYLVCKACAVALPPTGTYEGGYQ